MKYNIKSKSFDLTPAISQYIEGRMAAIRKLIQQSDEGAIADVEIEKITKHHRTGELYRAEINLTLAGQDLFRAEATEFNIYNALNAVKEEIIRQIKSKNKKQRSLSKKGGRQLKEIMRGFWPGRR